MELVFYQKSNLYRRLVQAKLFIDGHFFENINTELIAGEAYFSKFHFIRTFKEIYGYTPRQYLIEVRINEAKKLLESGMPVEEACYSVGFESVSTFSGLFKKRVGLPPSTFREKQTQLRNDRQARPFKYIPGCHIVALHDK